jgi:hypothetical protein
VVTIPLRMFGVILLGIALAPAVRGQQIKVTLLGQAVRHQSSSSLECDYHVGRSLYFTIARW